MNTLQFCNQNIITGIGLEELDRNIRKSGMKPKLKTFIAGRNRQEVGGSAALAKAFSKLQSLEEITLHQNGITWKGALALRKIIYIIETRYITMITEIS